MNEVDKQPATTSDARITRRRVMAIIVIVSIILLVFLILTVLRITLSDNNPAKLAFSKTSQLFSFPLYYPSSMPSYFFVDTGSMTTSNNTLIFPISRNDGQKIIVTEQQLPVGFDTTQVTGTRTVIPNLGTIVLGSGYLGNRSVIVTQNTLMFISAPSTITVGDLDEIVKAFRPV
jgi:hypothetical protein